VRRQIGQRAWRTIHYLTFLGFVGATLHGITSGSDTSAPWATWAYLVPTAATVFFLVYRVVVSIAQRRYTTRPGLVPLAGTDTFG
jgi:DMSO/TMAO reductase YedYZ heme-binding membrane subunit